MVVCVPGMPLAEPLLESRQWQTDLDTLMMNATFRILGPSIEVPGALYTGSGFLVSRSSAGDPTRSFVAVSAAHVMSGITGDHAVFVVRMRNDQTRYQRAQFPVRIRMDGRPLWTEHHAEDVVAMHVRMPAGHAMDSVPIPLLATDEAFASYNVHPGDEVSSLGYPFGYEVNEFGFPLLRSGRIASFPLTPVRMMKQFFVDFSVGGGTSGGPVYISSQNRTFNNRVTFGRSVFSILGIVTQNALSPDGKQDAGITKVIHAQFIRDTLAALPAISN
jgi:trypsin-like peptidase